MTDLFPDVKKVLSPRKAWKQRHGILTHFSPCSSPAWMVIRPISSDRGLSIAECMARHARIYDEGGGIGYGHSQEEAERDLAVKIGLPLWNEPQTKNHEP